jgi:hypothetical protein
MEDRDAAEIGGGRPTTQRYRLIMADNDELYQWRETGEGLRS